jgi:hypothetical protein
MVWYIKSTTISNVKDSWYVKKTGSKFEFCSNSKFEIIQILEKKNRKIEKET